LKLEAKELRVLIAGGGTGGHVYPAISIAKGIKDRYPTASVLFVGTERGIETRIVPMEGFSLSKITVSGLKGLKGVDCVRGLLNIPKSLWESHKIIQGFRPHVVIGVGGYSSGPPVLLASLKGIPTLLQEQNALPGLTNRLLAYFASRVATAFKESEQFFGRKAALTGNPVREDFKQIPPKKDRDRFTLLIFGGSQGAHPLNKAVVEALELLQPRFSEMAFVHQTGERDYEWVARAYQRFEAVSDVRPFFNDMPVQFAGADMLLCRSGATTLAEITVAGKAAILVPFPLATDNHQQKNAEALMQAGAAEMILQKDLTGQGLAVKIQYFLTHREELRRMECKSRALGRADSTERIVDLVEDLLHV
jgi:UDP-N-acetylglucosamine--N-acetylmuramyl-(pentapeptide) pyrophosphoryl-undecaprenol N-acetylglucosamine transferase